MSDYTLLTRTSERDVEIALRAMPVVRHIRLLGVELEGFWGHPMRDGGRQSERQLADRAMRMCGDYELVHDGSLPSGGVCGDCDSDDEDRSDCSCGIRDMFAREMRVGPVPLDRAIRDVAALYPEGCSGDTSMHVHVSLVRPAALAWFTSDHFYEYHRASWKEWGKALGVKCDWFRNRLAGQPAYPDGGSYCALSTEAQWRRNGRLPNWERAEGSRYQQVNPQAYARHGTVEFRLLPMFRDRVIALLALAHTARIVEEYLENDMAPPIDIRAKRARVDMSPVSESIGVSHVHSVGPLVIADEVPMSPVEVPTARTGGVLVSRAAVRRAVQSRLNTAFPEGW